MFLCKSISKPNKKALKHPINGTYKMNDDGIFKLSVVGFTRGSLVKGAFLMDGNNWERGTMEGIVASTNNDSIKNQISKNKFLLSPVQELKKKMQVESSSSSSSVISSTTAVATTAETTTETAAETAAETTTEAAAEALVLRGPFRTVGVWKNGLPSDDLGWNGVEFISNETMSELNGIWTKLKSNCTMVTGKWNIVRDDFVQVSYRKDYTTSYLHGRMEFGTRTKRHDVKSMLNSFFASAVLGGDNKVECSTVRI